MECWVERSKFAMEDWVLAGFGIECNTAIGDVL